MKKARLKPRASAPIFLCLFLIAGFGLCPPRADAAETVGETLQRVIGLRDLPSGYRQLGVGVETANYRDSSKASVSFAPRSNMGLINVMLEQYRSADDAERAFGYSLQSIRNQGGDIISLDAGIGSGSYHKADRNYLDSAHTRYERVSQFIEAVWKNWVVKVYLLGYNRRDKRVYSDADAEAFVRRIAALIVSRLEGGAVEEEAPDCGKAGALTRYLEALRAHQRMIADLDDRFQSWLTAPPADRARIAAAGREALAAGTAFQKTLRDFRMAETRRGLFEELDLVVETPIRINQMVMKYQKLANVPVTPLDTNDAGNARTEASRSVLDLARQYYAARLESEGLRDILTSNSWNEAVDTAAYHAQRKVDEFLDRETEKLFGLGFHDAQSARRAMRLQVRREIRRQVAKLLVKVTSNEIVIEIVAGPLIRWLERDLWPRLREALRQKGNLPERVTRSLQTMENARRELNQLACDARLAEVRRRLDKAAGVLHAARYLDRDLRNANAAAELARLGEGQDHLSRTIFLARNRFLLVKDDYEEDLAPIEALVAQMLDNLKRSIPADSGGEQRYQHADTGGAIDLDVARQLLEGLERTTGGPDIPALGARVTAVKLYEEGVDTVPPSRRAYGTRWPRSSLRALWWDLFLEFPDPGRRIDFRIDAVYTAADGRVVTRHSLDAFIEAGWITSQHTSGWGWASPGGWAPGKYRVELSVSGRRVGAAEFEVTD